MYSYFANLWHFVLEFQPLPNPFASGSVPLKQLAQTHVNMSY